MLIRWIRIRIRNTSFYYPRYIDIDIKSLSLALFLTRLTYSIFNIQQRLTIQILKKGKRRWENACAAGKRRRRQGQREHHPHSRGGGAEPEPPALAPGRVSDPIRIRMDPH
jgi:hypothetical protein